MQEFGRFFGKYGIQCPGCPYELEHKIAVPPLFVFIGMTYEDIEMLEGDIYVCPSDCGYFYYADRRSVRIHLSPTDDKISWQVVASFQATEATIQQYIGADQLSDFLRVVLMLQTMQSK